MCTARHGVVLTLQMEKLFKPCFIAFKPAQLKFYTPLCHIRFEEHGL